MSPWSGRMGSYLIVPLLMSFKRLLMRYSILLFILIIVIIIVHIQVNVNFSTFLVQYLSLPDIFVGWVVRLALMMEIESLYERIHNWCFVYSTIDVVVMATLSGCLNLSLRCYWCSMRDDLWLCEDMKTTVKLTVIMDELCLIFFILLLLFFNMAHFNWIPLLTKWLSCLCSIVMLDWELGCHRHLVY